ncbi:aminoglycoside N(3)-acetyltransferase [Mangrovibacillus cuniculi]|uniref:Aminoglycoside N(3)-acetyltransferase n=1 Tax=Mangrovibacillus cuniculi TaxID=2593652 RepID=A0A7S8CAS9_9BACI|nr:AAC(3) family N-acetyltransferase [Mangrovibacillus cuniculi]QPC46561.1 AAC(3) family N-acetyltransferase [Mangrovibacillus cuniculi]
MEKYYLANYIHEVMNMVQKNMVTKTELVRVLKQLLPDNCSSVIIHTSLSSIGYIPGGTQSYIDAWIEVMSNEGTIIMPAQNANNSDPSFWKNPPVPKEWWQTIRDEMPAYRKDITPTAYIGKVPETFRQYPGVERSSHPTCSFAALGPLATYFMGTHPLDDCFNLDSPLGRIIEKDTWCALVGVGYDACTAMHLGEALSGKLPLFTQGSAILNEKGKREWVNYLSREERSEDFPLIGNEFEKTYSGDVIKGKIGEANITLIKLKPLVEYTAKWFKEEVK